MSIKTDVLEIINSLENPQFTLEDISKIRPDINKRTLSTTVGRDLKYEGYLRTVNKHKGWGKPQIYERIENPEPIQVTRKNKKKEQHIEPLQKYTNSIEYAHQPEPKFSYSIVGKAIEALLEEKNQLIAEFEKENKRLEKQLLDAEATIQERERHINQQTLKIHELSEKCRSRSGGSIKLDELQSTLRNAVPK